ncbi:MAG: 30S ribosomal protein S3 [Candidatus Hadarchaeales archaeon]
MPSSSELWFIKYGFNKAKVEEFLAEKLGRAGYGGMDVQQTPTGTKITLYVERPGMVIGKGGESIKELTETLEKEYGVRAPEIEVLEMNPDLCAPILARRIASALEKGVSVRRLGHAYVKRVMAAGARGVEIRISGKIAGERARSERFFQGYLSKSGEHSEKFVSTGYAQALIKPGAVGVKVKVMLPEGIDLKALGRKKEVSESGEAESG